MERAMEGLAETMAAMETMDEVVTVVMAVMGRLQMVMVAMVAEAHTMIPEAEVGVDIDTDNLITRC
jgi:hypothetical protein